MNKKGATEHQAAKTGVLQSHTVFWSHFTTSVKEKGPVEMISAFQKDAAYTIMESKGAFFPTHAHDSKYVCAYWLFC